MAVVIQGQGTYKITEDNVPTSYGLNLTINTPTGSRQHGSLFPASASWTPIPTGSVGNVRQLLLYNSSVVSASIIVASNTGSTNPGIQAFLQPADINIISLAGGIQLYASSSITGSTLQYDFVG